MPSPLRELLARLAAELPAATALADPLLDGSLAPQPRAAQNGDSPLASGGRQPPEASRELGTGEQGPGTGGQNAGYGLQAPGYGSSNDAIPATRTPQPIASAAGSDPSDADRLDAVQLALESRLEQIEGDWTQALEQLAELFRRAFATKTEHATLADRLRDLENAHILRGRL